MSWPVCQHLAALAAEGAWGVCANQAGLLLQRPCTVTLGSPKSLRMPSTRRERRSPWLSRKWWAGCNGGWPLRPA
eukprot:11197209-Lingulodinium_polyedra.AAC.1